MHGQARVLVYDSLVVAFAVTAATLVVGAVETWIDVPNASVVYLVAVVACGLAIGSAAAVVVALGGFLVYTYFFTEPVGTFTVSDPEVLLTLVLLLFTGLVVGRLAAVQRERTALAEAREREARSLFGVSRVLATRESTEALPAIAVALRDATGMGRVWITLGADVAGERVVADSGTGPAPSSGRVQVLQRRPGDEPAAWTTVIAPELTRRQGASQDVYRVRIEVSGEALGSILASRPRTRGMPDRTATRLMAGAADQVGQAIARDRAESAGRAAAIARQSDQLKSSLLQTVSHDFRTPLAVIRAAAGSLGEGVTLPDEDRLANIAAIDREVEYLDHLVANLLDLSRIEAGSLRARIEIYDIDDVLGQTIERATSRLGQRTLESDIPPLPVRVDPAFLGATVTNVLENALKYTPPNARIRITAMPGGDHLVRLTVEDDGPGVVETALPHLFERFYRVDGTHGDARGGMGIGLAVARGLTEAMGGGIAARRSELGGLAIDLNLPAAKVHG
jgi:two-component system, OmpR family, sensor histidine kinase KdpD